MAAESPALADDGDAGCDLDRLFEGLPAELEEAALVGGANIWQAFRYVAIPLARPGITVAMILAFIFSWNNFIFGVVLAGRSTRALPVVVYNVLTFEQLGVACRDSTGAAADASDAKGNRRWSDGRRGKGRVD